jgi:hypothetical protein
VDSLLCIKDYNYEINVISTLREIKYINEVN